MGQGATPFEEGRNQAVRFLLVRPRSVDELRTKLLGKGFRRETVDEVASWLEKGGCLNGRSFAAGLARTLAVHRLWGDFRIRLSLRERGVSTDVADEALREARRELGEEEAIRKYVQKKYGKTIESDINSKDFTPGEKRRLYRSLSNRGFPGGLILEIIRMPKEDVIHDGE